MPASGCANWKDDEVGSNKESNNKEKVRSALLTQLSIANNAHEVQLVEQKLEVLEKFDED